MLLLDQHLVFVFCRNILQLTCNIFWNRSILLSIQFSNQHIDQFQIFKCSHMFIYYFLPVVQILSSTMTMKMNCFFKMVDRWQGLHFIASQDHYQSKILTITNLRQATNRVSKYCWIKLCSSDNHYIVIFYFYSWKIISLFDNDSALLENLDRLKKYNSGFVQLLFLLDWNLL